MASVPWILPDDFDSNSVEAWLELTDRLTSLGRALSPESIRALRAGDIGAFLRLSNVDFVTNELLPLQAVIQRQTQSAATAIYTEAGVDAILAFDLIDARSVEFAQTQVGKLIRQISDEARQNIQDIISQAESGKYTYQQAADLIEQGLGLTSRQNQAVDNFYSRNFQRFINDGNSETTARLKAKRLTDEYRQKSISRRAQTIARTEIADAAMNGRYMGWEAGITAGVIDGASVKEWIAEPDACPICLPLDGTIVSWNSDYEFGVEGLTGTTNKMPPAHPNCRCVVALLPPDFADSIFTNQANPDTNVDAKAQVEEYRDDSVMADAQLVQKHGNHDQSSHGNWAAGFKSASTEDLPNLDDASQDVVKAKTTYMNSGYEWMNGYLRSGDIDDELRTGVNDEILSQEEGLQQISDLSQALYEKQTTQDLMVTRVTRSGRSITGKRLSEMTDKDISDLESKTYVAKGFTSTFVPESINQNTVNTFAAGTGVSLNIRMPEGTYGATIGNLRESEFVLPPDTSFVITSAKRDGPNRLTIDLLVSEQNPNG